MAAFDYARLQRTASRLLSRFNQGAIILQRVTTTPDANEPWKMTSGIQNHTLAATVAGVLQDDATSKFVDGSTILASDLSVTCAAGVAPLMTDTLTIDGAKKTIKKVLQVPAAGTPIAFKLIVGS